MSYPETAAEYECEPIPYPPSILYGRCAYCGSGAFGFCAREGWWLDGVEQYLGCDEFRKWKA